MPYIANKSSLSVLNNGVKTAFARGMSNGERDLNWKKIASEIRSNTMTENYAWLGTSPAFRELIGERQIQNMQQYSYSLQNKKFELTIGVPRDTVEDDQYGVYLPMFEEMGTEGALLPEKLVFEKLAAGFSDLCYDGTAFFNASHPVGGSTVSNYDSGVGNPWFLMDTRRSLKPLILQLRQPVELVSKLDSMDDNVLWDEEYIFAGRGRMVAGYGLWQYAFGAKSTLNSTNFDSAIEAMMANKSDEGRPMGIMPDTLIVGPSNRAEALSILEAQFLASGASNVNFKAMRLIVSPYLA